MSITYLGLVLIFPTKFHWSLHSQRFERFQVSPSTPPNVTGSGLNISQSLTLIFLAFLNVPGIKHPLLSWWWILHWKRVNCIIYNSYPGGCEGYCIHDDKFARPLDSFEQNCLFKILISDERRKHLERAVDWLPSDSSISPGIVSLIHFALPHTLMICLSDNQHEHIVFYYVWHPSSELWGFMSSQ